MKERDHLLAKGGIWLAGNEEILLSISRHKRGWMMMVEYYVVVRVVVFKEKEKLVPREDFPPFSSKHRR